VHRGARGQPAGAPLRPVRRLPRGAAAPARPNLSGLFSLSLPRSLSLSRINSISTSPTRPEWCPLAPLHPTPRAGIAPKGDAAAARRRRGHGRAPPVKLLVSFAARLGRLRLALRSGPLPKCESSARPCQVRRLTGSGDSIGPGTHRRWARHGLTGPGPGTRVGPRTRPCPGTHGPSSMSDTERLAGEAAVGQSVVNKSDGGERSVLMILAVFVTDTIET
jgi:hypothetical protein